MTTTQTEQARTKFLQVIRGAAVEFGEAAPLSVPRADRDRAIDRVIAAFRAQAAKNPKFYTATPASLGRAISLCALTGLMPGGPLPHCDLIPRQRRVKGADGRWSDGEVEVDWQIGWRGYVELAARAGCRARPVPVFLGEPFEWVEGLDRDLRHTPIADGESEDFDQLVLVYVVATFRDKSRDFEVLRRDGIEARRDKSEAWQRYLKARQQNDEAEIKRASQTPWVEWPVEMSRKTAMRFAASRGLLAFDEVAQYGFAEDGKRDVIDASEVATRAAAAAVAAANRPSLPDTSFLDEVEEQPPQRGMDAVRAAVSQSDSARVTDPPPAESSQSSSSPSTSHASPAGTGSSGDDQGDKPQGDKPGVRNDLLDGERLRDHLLTTKGPGATMPLDAFRRSLCSVCRITKVGLDRLDGVLATGVSRGWWIRPSKDEVRLAGESAARPTSSALVVPDPWPGPNDPGVVSDRVRADLAVIGDRARAVLDRAGVRTLEGATEPELRRALVATTEHLDQHRPTRAAWADTGSSEGEALWDELCLASEELGDGLLTRAARQAGMAVDLSGPILQDVPDEQRRQYLAILRGGAT